MGIEIERKFLITSSDWRAGVVRSYVLRDGLLARFGEGKVRIRHAGSQAWITVKGPRSGISRAEFEYEVPVSEAEEMLSLCGMPHIEKHRYIVPHAGFEWAVDLHQGPLAGIEFAEVELEHPDQPVPLPGWVGAEVTNDPNYSKATLLSRLASALGTGGGAQLHRACFQHQP
ncbi:CYTH domain-containing protein [Roseomonas sp. SSH11]|uniref:CYTH domain-containing protein n=1 Tax=Pararoseomonas baculiformis TaxID=2820812 RepID=A0ABS4AKH2_9PROT|nr:CYTH domain-containing protein [Pararoseomonas baculiformis]